MRLRDLKKDKLYEYYIYNDGGDLWLNNDQDEALIKQRRKGALKYIGTEEEQMLYHSFFSEMGLSNKFEPGSARIISDMQFGHSMKYMSKIIDFKDIVTIISDIQSESEKYDEDLNGKTFDELKKQYETSLTIQQMRMDRRIVSREYEANPNYSIIEISSFEQARPFSKYFKKHPWELLLNKENFDDFS